MKKNKKTVLKVFLILLISTVMFLLLQHIYVKLMSPKVNLEKSDKGIIVKYTIVDEESSKGYDTIDDIMDKNEDSIIYNSYGFETISKKDSNTYEGTLSNANEMLTNGVVDYAFAKMNTNGEVITDAKYDKKTKKLTIPAKYIEKESIQMQVLVKLSSDKIVNTKVKTKILNGSIKNSTITLNGFDTQSYITLDDYDSNKNIDKSSINVYVNKKYKVKDENYSYDKKSKTIKLTLNPLLANNIEVVIEKQSIAEKLFKTVFADLVDIRGDAVTSDDADGIKLDANPENLTADDKWHSQKLRWAYYNGRIPHNGTSTNGAVNAYLNVEKQNAAKTPYENETISSTETCADGNLPTADNPYPKCPERNLVANVMRDARYVMGFPGSNITSTNYKKDANFRDSNFIISHDYDTETNTGTKNDVEFAIMLDKEMFGSNFIHDDDNSSVLYGDDYFWVAAYCLHISRNADEEKPTNVEQSKTLNFQYKVLYKNNDDNIMIIQFLMPTNQEAGTQNAYGVYKFYWEDEPEAKIRVEKKFYEGTKETSISDKSGVEFKIYKSKNDCINSRKSKGTATTNKSGLATFDSDGTEKTFKMNTTYYVKETSLGTKFSTNDWTMDTRCTKVKVTKKNADSTEKEDGTDTVKFYIKSITKKNKKKYYCLKVQKTDAETGQSLPGISFKITPTNAIGVSDADGVVTFSKLTYGTTGTYTIEETSNDGTNGYWNDYKNGGNSLDYTLTAADEMDYDSDGKPTSCKSTTQVWHKTDHKQYYCIKVKKVDKASGTLLPGATFQTTIAGQTVTKKDSDDGADDGVTTFFLGANPGTYSIIETAAPAGYAKYNGSISVSSNLLPRELSYSDAEAACLKADATNDQGYNIAAAAISVDDSKYLLNWHKVNESGAGIGEAKFRVQYTDTTSGITYYVQALGGEYKKTQKDANNVEKVCYPYSGLTTNESAAAVFVSDSSGDVCISGIPENTNNMYDVIETNPSPYHTFGEEGNEDHSTYFKTISISTTFTNNNNTFINYPTEFIFTKDVSSGDEADIKIVVNGVEKTLKDLTTEELMKLKFNVFNSNNQKKLQFKKIGEGAYDFTGNIIDPASNLNDDTSYEDLTLNSYRQIMINHLPIGKYTIKEKNSNTCDASSDDSECVGYYYPDYTSDSDYTFEITECSSRYAVACGDNGHSVYKSLTNTPTELTFTKKDFYNYYDAADKNKSDENVDFVDAKERNDFDKIVFKIKDSNKRYLTLKKIRDVGDCSTNDSYSEYRYVSSDQSDTNGTELHTCGGHIKITNLCRGNTYTVEEVSVPNGSVYVKEDTKSTPTSVSYKIPCVKGKTEHDSSTITISDKPTRVRFEKRDSKYNYLIDDETTTFEVYKCAKGTECHPADYKTVEEREKNGMTLVKFNPRAVITKDEEDPTDAAGLAGVEVYKKISDSDVSKGQKYVTSLHPYKGLLVLRYLESNDPNSSYVLLETVAPKNYSLPSGRNAETRFTVTNTTVKVDEVDVPNKPTSLIIRKYSDDGKLLPGAEFKVYEGTSCDANLSAMNQPKKLLKLKTIRDGVYENRPEQDTDTVLTCTDKDGAKCSDIAINNMTSLTYKNYQNTWADFNESLTNDNKKVEIKEGEALIQYLEYDHCYIIEETKAPKGYSLPKNDEDRFTMVTIPKNTEYVSDTYKTLINKPTPFTFYKYDEYNNLLDGAEFKLQKLDSNKKYHDITVTKEETETGVFYKVDKSTDNKVITTKDGKATVYYLEEGQYRIVETKAAPGKELGKNPNVATFFVDSAGNVYGNSIIVNKEKTKSITLTSSASAEFLIWNRTGQTVIRYGLIISSIVAVIVALMIALRIKKKSE